MSEKRPFFSMPKTAGDLVVYTLLVATLSVIATLVTFIAIEKSKQDAPKTTVTVH